MGSMLPASESVPAVADLKLSELVGALSHAPYITEGQREGYLCQSLLALKLALVWLLS
jgi:hypothetical protein